MFVTFEGVDGSGKSTQARLLSAALAADGVEVVSTREPGGTVLGERIRELVLSGPQMGAWAEAALFAAARAQLAEELIRPALARGAFVVADRYLDSSLAYQGVARGLGIDGVLALNAAVDDLLPDLTLLLRVDPAAALGRLDGDGDRLEAEGLAFQTAVARGYEEVARRFPGRVRVVDGSGAPDAVAVAVREEVGRVRRDRRAG